jgi:Zn-dependent protease with chaperone function
MKMRALFVFLALVLLGVPLFAHTQDNVDLSQSQMPSVLTVPPEALPSDHFNAEPATNAYLANLGENARVGRTRVWARFPAGLDLLGAVPDHHHNLERPLDIYEGYFREHKYGLATQTFGPWLSDQLKLFGVGLVLFGILIALLFWIARKLPNSWHIWGAVVTVCFMMFVVMIGPVYILPLTNKVTRLDDPKITTPILSLASANGIPAHDVYKVDASKQSTRMSANVSGLGKTMRITLNDNLLRRGSPEEIQDVMGHEMGHYVLNHV